MKEKEKDLGVLINLNKNLLVELNSTGRVISQKLFEGTNLNELEKIFFEKFPKLSPKKISRDIKCFLNLLEKNGFIGKVRLCPKKE